MQAKELRAKSEQELQKEMQLLLKEQFSLRMQKGMEEAPRSHEFKRIRRDIARIKTILKENHEHKL